MVNAEEPGGLVVQSAMHRPALLLARRTIRNVFESGRKGKVGEKEGLN